LAAGARFVPAAEMLKAAAHPTRLSILNHLRGTPMCVSDIEHLLPVSQVNVSQHLTVLRHAGLVGNIQEGALRCYYLAQPELVEALFGVIERDYRHVTLTKEDILRRRGLKECPAHAQRQCRRE